MDPVSHAVFGYTVVRAARPAAPRIALAACLGALAPDVDALFMPFGWDVYLRVHEIGTHSLVGSILVALIVAVAVRGRSRLAVGPLIAAAVLGSLSHIALDVLSGARIQVAWPAMSRRSLVPLVAMAEPWVIGFFAATAIAFRAWPNRAMSVGRCSLAMFALLLSLKGIWLVQAVATLGARPDVEARIIEARWFTLRDWHVYERTPHALEHLVIAPSRPPTLVESWPKTPETAVARQSRGLDTVRNLLDVHELTFARERPTQDGKIDVFWSDIRFCWSPTGEIDTNDASPLVLGAGATRIACALWFGGSFADDGRALTQRVQVFGRWQIRPAPP